MSFKNFNSVNSTKPKNVAIVVANPAISTTTGWPVGFWWSEVTHPYWTLVEHGYNIEIFSPDGGKCEADDLSNPQDPSGYSASDLISLGFINKPELMELINNTKPVSAIDSTKFDAILISGGKSPMFSFEKAITLHNKFAEFYENGKIAAALCHGVALLRYVKLKNGEYLVKGKTVTGFANIEEDLVDNSLWDIGALSRDKHVVPWRIEDELKKLGANYIQAGAWKGFAIRDGNLITGQQHYSGTEIAELMINALGE